MEDSEIVEDISMVLIFLTKNIIKNNENGENYTQKSGVQLLRMRKC